MTLKNVNAKNFVVHFYVGYSQISIDGPALTRYPPHSGLVRAIWSCLLASLPLSKKPDNEDQRQQRRVGTITIEGLPWQMMTILI